MSRYAPVLQDSLHYIPGRAGTRHRAMAELKALIILAKAAEYEGWGADHHETRAKGTCRLCKAIWRLRKLSGFVEGTP